MVSASDARVATLCTYRRTLEQQPSAERDARSDLDATKGKSKMKRLYLTELLVLWRPGSQGDDWTWQQESDDLWSREQARMDVLCTSIQETGMQEPVLIGDDGRIWDGHHRIVAAMTLGLETIPVEYSWL